MGLIYLQGLCRAQIHDVDKALEHYSEVLAIDPKHWFTHMNVIEINFFGGRYEEAVKYIDKMNQIIDSRANGKRLPLLDFKKLVSLTKLSENTPEKYEAQVKQLSTMYTYI